MEQTNLKQVGTESDIEGTPTARSEDKREATGGSDASVQPEPTRELTEVDS